MRVVNVNDIKSRQKQRAKKEKASVVTKRVLAMMFMFLLIGGAGYFFVAIKPDFTPKESQSRSESQNNSESIPGLPDKSSTLISLSGNEYRDLYRSVNYPNVTRFQAPPIITGNIEADDRIRALAVERGFVLTSYPTTAIVAADEALVAGTEDNLLQPLALNAWKQLKRAAQDASIPLELSSGYRSVERQRELFLERLGATGSTVDQIAAGLGDSAIQQTLYLTAPPGFSRHHTGYTIDLVCGEGVESFMGSQCDEWLQNDEFSVAKKHGWIPSYPNQANAQGPEPEPWEYVWVGTRLLYE